MSQDSNFLKTTLDLLETDPDVKSYIYQQIADFNAFVTPETLVMVIARDPKASYSTEIENIEEQDADYSLIEQEALNQNYQYRIAVILKDGEATIEAEAFDNNVFDAIRLAKEKLVLRLIEIQDEMENPNDRMKAIRVASDNTQIH